MENMLFLQGGISLNVDTLIINADLFTMQGEGVGYVDCGAVAIDKGRIIEVGSTEALQKEFTAEETIDATNMMVLPGFVDAHMHTYWAILRGVAQDTHNWMLRGVEPFRPYLTDENMTAGAKMNVLEGLATGTTTFCDYTFPALDSAKFFHEIGVRACVTGFVREVPKVLDKLEVGELYPFDPSFGEYTLNRNLELIEKWHGKDNNRIQALLGPQGPDFMSAEFMKKVKNLATEKDVKIHMHVAQSTRETEQILKRYNKRSIALLDELGFLDESLIAVHLTDATEEEVKLLVDRNVSMVVCSGSIGVIAGRVPPAYSFIKAGGNVGLGSDQASGNNCNQVINEMKLTALFNKVKYTDPEVIPAWKALRMGTIEGARAVGLGDDVGSLERGKKADIIFVDLGTRTMQPVIKKPMRNHVPNLVYSARGDEIRRVMVDGKTLFLNGEYLTVNEAEIMSDAQKLATELTEQVREEDFKNTKSYELMQNGKL